MRRQHTPDQLRRKIAESCALKEDTGCWIWMKGKCAGYGWMFTGLKSEYAHKVSFEVFVGKIEQATSNVLVLHTCNTRACVNPSHLYLGTRADNTNDALRDGCYEDRIKFREEDEAFICYLFSKGVPARMIAKMYLSNHTRICHIVKSQPNYNELLQAAINSEEEKKVARYSTIVAMKAIGCYNREIAEKLNLSITQIKRILSGGSHAVS